MNNVEVFNDTRKRIEIDERLKKATADLRENTKIYPEQFYSIKTVANQIPYVSFEENLTLITAQRCAAKGNRTAVLNFANPVTPGGGVVHGARAQEEYLCRASNLYASLCGEKAKPFYLLHRNIRGKNQYNSMFLATDTVIYSPQVTVFRADQGYAPDTMNEAIQEYTEDWYNIDVITCAAPLFSGTGYIVPDGDLEHIFQNRIRNIFEAAIDNDVQSLVLGAFGCGAFHNPPQVVANAFSDVLQEDRYKHAFQEVVFAVKRSGTPCKNIEAFANAFTEFPPTEK
jgi:uncharacterized protein (TIGR02452 family)